MGVSMGSPDLSPNTSQPVPPNSPSTPPQATDASEDIIFHSIDIADLSITYTKPLATLPQANVRACPEDLRAQQPDKNFVPGAIAGVKTGSATAVPAPPENEQTKVALHTYSYTNPGEPLQNDSTDQQSNLLDRLESNDGSQSPPRLNTNVQYLSATIAFSPQSENSVRESPPQSPAEGQDTLKIGQFKDLQAMAKAHVANSPSMDATTFKVEKYLSMPANQLAAIPPASTVYITPKGKIFVRLEELGKGSFQQTLKVAQIGQLGIQATAADQTKFKALSMPKPAAFYTSPSAGQAAEDEASRMEIENVLEMHKHLKVLRATKGPDGQRVYNGSLSHVAGARIISHSPTGGSCVITEFCNGGNVDSHIQRAQEAAAKPQSDAVKTANKRQAYFLAAEMSKGLQQFHAAGLVHRDLKPDNFLIQQDDAGNVKKVMLGDFSKSAYNKSFVPGGRGYVPLYVPAKYYSRTDLAALGKVNSGELGQIVKNRSALEARLTNIEKDIGEKKNLVSILKGANKSAPEIQKEESSLQALTKEKETILKQIADLNKQTEVFYSESSDIYQMGITLYQVLCNVPMDDLDLAAHPGFDKLELDVQAMIRSMLDPDPSKRPTADQVEKFFRDKIPA